MSNIFSLSITFVLFFNIIKGVTCSCLWSVMCQCAQHMWVHLFLQRMRWVSELQVTSSVADNVLYQNRKDYTQICLNHDLVGNKGLNYVDVIESGLSVVNQSVFWSMSNRFGDVFQFWWEYIGIILIWERKVCCYRSNFIEDLHIFWGVISR